MLKDMDYWIKELLDTGINVSKKVIYKAAETTNEFIGSRIADAVTSSYDDKIVKTKTFEKLEIREKILNELTLI